MEKTLPYISAYGNITRCLERIINAQTPTTFSQDFLASVLKLTGGGARPVIKFLKNTGFLSEAGTPTTVYKNFRNSNARTEAVLEAMQFGYAELFKQNEYIHLVENESELKETIVATLGCAADDKRIAPILKSFSALKAFADFSKVSNDTNYESQDDPSRLQTLSKGDRYVDSTPGVTSNVSNLGLNLAYTINLNLPETTNPEVFNQIFRALKEHLISNE